MVSLELGPFTLHEVRTASTPAAVRSRQPGADAVLGNGVFSRFNAFFDYGGERLYLKPNRHYRPGHGLPTTHGD